MANLPKPVKRFIKGHYYIVRRNHGALCSAKCTETTPEVLLLPEGSTFSFTLPNFIWVMKDPCITQPNSKRR